MPEIQVQYPLVARNRGVGYWLHLGNLWDSRRKLRSDHSNEWRYAFEATNPSPTRVGAFSDLLTKPVDRGFRFVILGDTGEGDRSQYGLVPLIRTLEPDFLIINGDVAYPAGDEEDFLAGFFEPYRDLDIPVWAVPGNHEYYSKNRGQEFYEVFCTRKWAARWAAHGLRLVPQPGTYWELSDPGDSAPLIVLAVDSGMKADLDGTGSGGGDSLQLSWLQARLREAERRQRGVLLLWHIPALVQERHRGSTHLAQLHRLIASSSAVRAVVCAHEHNYQQYGAGAFADYIEKTFDVRVPAAKRPPYFVSGGGGAYLNQTAFKRGPFDADILYPTPDQWRDFAGRARRFVEKTPIGRSIIGRIVGLADEASLSDADVAQYLSLLLVEITPNGCVMTPVFLDDLESLFKKLPPGTVVNVTDRNLPLDLVKVRGCLQSKRAINLRW